MPDDAAARTEVWPDATAQAEAVRSGRASPVELGQDAVARLRRVDPQLSALVGERFDAALAEAAGPLPDGPLRGVPMLRKDLGCHVAGEVTGEGTRWLEGLPRPVDSALALSFRAAGLVVLGRTRVPELGTTVTTEPAAYGPTRNPYDLDRTVGGSSGGSAALVAAGAVALAHAGDGGGSIRIPASACGLVGLKPSRGRVSAGPEVGESWAGATTDGVLTRTVRDTALLLDVISGPQPGDPYTAPPPAGPYAGEVGADPGRLRVGLLTTPPQPDLAGDPACTAAVESTGRLLASLGHDVEVAHPEALGDPEFSRHFNRTVAADVALALAGFERLLGREIDDEELEPRNRAYRAIGRRATAVTYLESRAWLAQFSRRVAGWWAGGFDVLLTPTVNGPPPLLGTLEDGAAVSRWMPYGAQFNVTGQPAVSLPLHVHEGGLPLGLQLVAAYGREDLLLRVAAQLEAAAPWEGRRPGVH
ncbi:MAG TPA: amidase family protein [Mycobacteriales bacterium]|jgi:amidase|nr:amidase family protein [Mycobacteriales bacterium]